MKIALKSPSADRWHLPQDDVDEFLRAIKQGQAPPIDQLVARYPEHAAEVRRRCRMMLFTENLVAGSPVAASAKSTPASIAELGEYKIIRLLGSGGMGAVYEAAQPGLSRHVAIKVLSDLPVQVNRLRQRFAVEAEAASRLNHPNIVSVFDFGEDQGFKYLVMRYVDGCNLAQLISSRIRAASEDVVRTHLPAECLNAVSTWEKIATLGAQAASALHHAHQQGMIHRDVKPANLLLDKYGQLHVADFGLAKIHDEDSGITRAGDSIGTPRYMAPEALRGKAEKRSDIFGLGVTLWELATRFEAFGDGSASQMLQQRSVLELPAPHELNPDVPEALSCIIMRACASEPQHRYQSAEELQRDLNSFAHGNQRKDRRKQARGAGKSRRHWIVAARLAAGFALAFGISYFLLRRPATVLNGANASRHVAGAPEFIGLAEDRTIDVHLASGTTSFNEVKLQCYDPEGLCAMYQIVGGPDAECFVIHPDSGTILFRQTPVAATPHDANEDGIYEIDVAVSDSARAESMQLLNTPTDGGLGTFEPVRSALLPAPWSDSEMNQSLLCMATADGRTFFSGHDKGAGALALYRTERTNKGIWMPPTLLSADSGLPENIRGLSTSDGSSFLCVTSPSSHPLAPSTLYRCVLQPDGSFQCQRLTGDCNIPGNVKGLWSYDGQSIMYFVPGDGQLEQWFGVIGDDGRVLSSLISVGPWNSQLSMIDTVGWIQPMQDGSSNQPAHVRIHINN